jgi:hypothetical protein
MLLQLLRLLLWEFGQSKRIYLYLSVALPKIAVDGINVIALSPQSPGNKLMGNQEGFTLRLMVQSIGGIK